MTRSIAWSVAAVQEENAKKEVQFREKQFQEAEAKLHYLHLELKYAEERLEEISAHRRLLEARE